MDDENDQDDISDLLIPAEVDMVVDDDNPIVFKDDDELAESVMEEYHNEMINNGLTESDWQYFKAEYSGVLDLKLVRAERMHCTACNCHLGTAVNALDQRCLHPLLKVLVCRKCMHFYKSGEFETDEDGSEMYCRWCGEGGEVYCCVKCPFVFCKRCITRNLGAKTAKLINSIDDWMCFSCNPSQINRNRVLYWAIQKYSRIMIEKGTLTLDYADLDTDFSTCCSSPKKRPDNMNNLNAVVAKKPKINNSTLVPNIVNANWKKPNAAAAKMAARSSPAGIMKRKLDTILRTKLSEENAANDLSSQPVTNVVCMPDIISIDDDDDDDDDVAVSEPPPLIALNSKPQPLRFVKSTYAYPSAAQKKTVTNTTTTSLNVRRPTTTTTTTLNLNQKNYNIVFANNGASNSKKYYLVTKPVGMPAAKVSTVVATAPRPATVIATPSILVPTPIVTTAAITTTTTTTTTTVISAPVVTATDAPSASSTSTVATFTLASAPSTSSNDWFDTALSQCSDVSRYMIANVSALTGIHTRAHKSAKVMEELHNTLQTYIYYAIDKLQKIKIATENDFELEWGSQQSEEERVVRKPSNFISTSSVKPDEMLFDMDVTNDSDEELPGEVEVVVEDEDEVEVVEEEIKKDNVEVVEETKEIKENEVSSSFEHKQKKELETALAIKEMKEKVEKEISKENEETGENEISESESISSDDDEEEEEDVEEADSLNIENESKLTNSEIMKNNNKENKVETEVKLNKSKKNEEEKQKLVNKEVYNSSEDIFNEKQVTEKVEKKKGVKKKVDHLSLPIVLIKNDAKVQKLFDKYDKEMCQNNNAEFLGDIEEVLKSNVVVRSEGDGPKSFDNEFTKFIDNSGKSNSSSTSLLDNLSSLDIAHELDLIPDYINSIYDDNEALSEPPVAVSFVKNNEQVIDNELLSLG